MEFDFLGRPFLSSAATVVRDLKDLIERSAPEEPELEEILVRRVPYSHTSRLNEDFRLAAVDGSGEYPLLQQDDIFVHLAVAAGGCFTTQTQRQNKLAAVSNARQVLSSFVILRDDPDFVATSYCRFLQETCGLSLEDLVEGSDYVKVFNQFSRRALRPSDVRWKNLAFSKASEVGTHAYQLRSVAELALAVRLLALQPRYLLLDTSLVYFLLGESLYLPELLKRYLVCQAGRMGVGVLAVNKSHNIPNGDLIGRTLSDDFGLHDHWFIRLPSPGLGEKQVRFLSSKEIPPKLCVSYLFKFHRTSFPLRLDVDLDWWNQVVKGDAGRERQLFEDLDFTCHDVRAYGYPYPLYAAHRSSSITRQERKAIRDIIWQNAQTAGILRGSSLQDAESLHSRGI